MRNESYRITAARVIVTGFCSGYSPKMPGTAGTLAAALLLGGAVTLLPDRAAYLAAFLLIASIAIGIPALSYLLKREALTSTDDPQEVVIDEFIGYFTCMLWFTPDLVHLSLAFLLFRVFDILKPPPIRQLEALPGAYGVTVDDFVAGLFAAVALVALRYLLAIP